MISMAADPSFCNQLITKDLMVMRMMIDMDLHVKSGHLFTPYQEYMTPCLHMPFPLKFLFLYEYSRHVHIAAEKIRKGSCSNYHLILSNLKCVWLHTHAYHSLLLTRSPTLTHKKKLDGSP